MESERLPVSFLPFLNPDVEQVIVALTVSVCSDVDFYIIYIGAELIFPKLL